MHVKDVVSVRKFIADSTGSLSLSSLFWFYIVLVPPTHSLTRITRGPGQSHPPTLMTPSFWYHLPLWLQMNPHWTTVPWPHQSQNRTFFYSVQFSTINVRHCSLHPCLSTHETVFICCALSAQGWQDRFPHNKRKQSITSLPSGGQNFRCRSSSQCVLYCTVLCTMSLCYICIMSSIASVCKSACLTHQQHLVEQHLMCWDVGNSQIKVHFLKMFCQLFLFKDLVCSLSIS